MYKSLENKLKVGQRVIIGELKHDMPFGVNMDMRRHIGKVATIEYVSYHLSYVDEDERGVGFNLYSIDLDHGRFSWSSPMFRVHNRDTISIYKEVKV